MSIAITGKQVQEFWKFMSKRYDFQIVQKQDAKEMRIIGWALEQMGVMDKDSFLWNYSTTVCLGGWRAVYVPFRIGTGTRSRLISQACTCVHEAQHVVQATRDPKQPMEYLVSETSRTFDEVDAYRTTMEMYYYFTGRILTPGSLALKLRGYEIGERHRRTAKKHLIIASKVVQRGGVITGTSKAAIRYWNARQRPSDRKKVAYIKSA